MAPVLWLPRVAVQGLRDGGEEALFLQAGGGAGSPLLNISAVRGLVHGEAVGSGTLERVVSSFAVVLLHFARAEGLRWLAEGEVH